MWRNRPGSLIDAISSFFPEKGDSLRLRERVPESVNVFLQDWRVVVHGVGVMFVSERTGESVDVHVGFFGCPDAFDAWRLDTYAESIGYRDHSTQDRSWQSVLNELAALHLIQHHPVLPMHYRLNV